MKSLSLIALIFAAFCTGAAITAYVLVGRTDDYESPRVLSRPEASAEPEPAVLNTPSVSLQSSIPSRQIPLPARRTWIPNANAVTTSPVPTAVLQQSPHPSTRIGSSAAQIQFSTQIHPAAGVPRSRSVRFEASAPNSDRATPLVSRNDTHEVTSTKSTNPKSAKSALPPVETSVVQTSTPDSETEFHPSNPPPGKRAPWPRGNFSVDDERARAQMGWQAFADEIFDASLNPLGNETLK